ncbi:hypothetical protein BGW36DRAFT_371786, partial [Talaromyces proteolyticus]
MSTSRRALTKVGSILITVLLSRGRRRMERKNISRRLLLPDLPHTPTPPTRDGGRYSTREALAINRSIQAYRASQYVPRSRTRRGRSR